MKKLMLLAVACVTAVAIAGCTPAATTETPEQPTEQTAEQPEETAEEAEQGTDGAVLIVGTNPEFPPFEYLNDANEVDGFDIALMKELSNRIGMEMQVESMEFKGLIGALKAGKIDAIAAGMTVNEERLEACDFTTPYINSVQVVLVQKDSTIATAEDLAGKKIAVQEGTTGDFIATDDVENAEVSRFKRYLDAITELNNGRVDAIIIDSSPAAEFLKANEGLQQVEGLVMADEAYGIAVDKGNTELLDKLNAALEEIKADGTYDQLVDTYINN